MKSIAVIGGGIVGLATAFRLLEIWPNAKVTVFEKEETVGRHQSGNNSGVLHCGLYYAPGSLKARLAVDGIRQMRAFCDRYGIPHEMCGKLVVATSCEEVPRLHMLLERGQNNGLRGLRLLNPEQLREIEPYAAGVAAVHVPEEGIVDYGGVCQALVHGIVALGGRVLTGAAVTRIKRAERAWLIRTNRGVSEHEFLVNCAGLHCDRVSSIAGQKRTLRIVPFRGEYFRLRPDRQYLVRNLIYPVPDPRFPFLGVHFTRLIHGGIEAGPNAVLAFAREGYKKSDISLRDICDVLTYTGFWRFFRKHPAMCWNELQRSFSKELFCRSLNRLVPDVRVRDLQPGGAGVRAQAITASGDTVQDFCFSYDRNALHVLNAPSPGATASLAIGMHIAQSFSAAV